MVQETRRGNEPDLRRIGLHPDFWYPLARSKDVKKGKTHLAMFGGEPIVLARGESGEVFALDDRCAHRQFPLHKGVVCGETLKCAYHAWSYQKDGRVAGVPYLPKDACRPEGVKGYACREAYGYVFIFAGDREKAESPVSRIAKFSFEETQDHAFLAQSRVPLFVHARKFDGHESSIFASRNHGDDQADSSRLQQRRRLGRSEI